jgi:hypothetical protein
MRLFGRLLFTLYFLSFEIVLKLKNLFFFFDSFSAARKSWATCFAQSGFKFKLFIVFSLLFLFRGSLRT